MTRRVEVKSESMKRNAFKRLNVRKRLLNIRGKEGRKIPLKIRPETPYRTVSEMGKLLNNLVKYVEMKKWKLTTLTTECLRKSYGFALRTTEISMVKLHSNRQLSHAI